MKSLRVENLRSIADSGSIELKPINLLVGANSSGKSTFIRCFPLLKQSVESRRTAPLLWWGRLVDYGMFSDVKMKGSNDQCVSLTYEFQIDPPNGKAYIRDSFSRRIYFDYKIRNSIVFEAKVSIGPASDSDVDSTRIYRFSLKFSGHNVEYEFSKEGVVVSAMVNGQEYVNELPEISIIPGTFLPTFLISSKDIPDSSSVRFMNSRRRVLYPLQLLAISSMKGIVDRRTGYKTKREIIDKIALGSYSSMFFSMKCIDSTVAWNREKSKASCKDKRFRRLVDSIVLYRVTGMMSDFDDYINQFAFNVKYIDPLRASAERYYRPQELAVDEVDPKGKNLALLLNSFTRNRLKKFQKWTDEYFGFRAKTEHKGGHISILIERGGEPAVNLIDMGFGFSQLLPIITQLWIGVDGGGGGYYTPIRDIVTVYAIEQPELHLHPKMQARLADVFIAVTEWARENDKDIRIVLETHSDVIINRIGNRISRGQYSCEDVNVVLFSKSDGVTEVKTTEYDENGFLISWPLGFLEPERLHK